MINLARYTTMPNIFRLIVLFSIFYSTAAFANVSLVYKTTDTLKKDTIPPQYTGGIDLFYEYLKTNIKFPIASRLKGVQGKVMVKFVVDSAGQISNVKIKKGLDKYSNKEALRVMRQSPKWIAGTIKGKKVGFSYDIPLSFLDTVSMAGASVMVNGNLLKSNRETKKLNLDTLPFYIITRDLAQAIFGASYNKKLVVFNDSTINLSGYGETHFKNTFKMLQHIDTNKVQLNVSEKVNSIGPWRQYLNKDSILSVYVYPSASYNTLDKKKLGTVTLVTKAGLDRQKKIKATLIENIIAYRSGVSPLGNEMLLIDNYHYNSAAIFNRIDTSIIHMVNILSPAEAVNLFGEAYKNGIIYIYTKRFQSNKQITDRQKLLTLIAQYKQDGKFPSGHFIFLNNSPIADFAKLTELPSSDIQYVNMISKEEAKAFFGDQEQSGIIYVNTRQNSIK